VKFIVFLHANIRTNRVSRDLPSLTKASWFGPKFSIFFDGHVPGSSQAQNGAFSLLWLPAAAARDFPPDAPPAGTDRSQ